MRNIFILSFPYYLLSCCISLLHAAGIIVANKLLRATAWFSGWDTAHAVAVACLSCIQPA